MAESISSKKSGWHVEILSIQSEQSYNAFMNKVVTSHLSHTLLWRDVLLQMKCGEPVYWLAFQDGELLGVLPSFVLRNQRGSVLNSLPFFQSTGGVVAFPELDPDTHIELTSRLLQAMLEWCSSHEINSATVIGSPFHNNTTVVSSQITPDYLGKRTVRVIDLTGPLDFRQSVVWTINKAAKCNMKIQYASTLPEAKLVYDIYRENMIRIDVEPTGWTFFEHLFRLTSDEGISRFIWAEYKNEPVASMVLLWYRGIVDYYAIGSTDVGREIQANTWLCSTQIKAAQDDGFTWWNWMASPTEQVYNYKKRYGGTDRTYPIMTWVFKDISTWKHLSPDEIAKLFPGYYVIPYHILHQETNND
ncbi:GNAT family N-acetyltransferase [Candidatus Latescibacterota bacterium]